MWQSDKTGNQVNDEVWLKDRYDLFQKYCVPSITHQSEKDFKWLVYFDIDTPKRFRKINQQIISDLPCFIPKYVNGFNDFETSLPSHIVEMIDESTTHIITTRLDNDDCLHKDTVAAIQKNFQPKKQLIIDLTRGLTLQVTKGYRLGLREGVFSGPFISLIEKVSGSESPLTVYDREHTSWYPEVPIKSLDKEFYWLQIIHERNVLNKLSAKLTSNKVYLTGYEFLLPINFKWTYYIQIFLENMYFFKILKYIKNKVKSKFSSK
ncbi:glycosyltransferase [uncultured Psychroserpens sp.]|uniref:glycosyltransferase n=1 Tax=uncultured Psychroserpens sp. TaxID=255436 RepID=UPI002626187B|nr:glycosyltransferase [uncultured Psychroserpens sp.]